MPELPEVETIKLGLQPKIIGQKITNITILNPNTFSGDPQTVVGQKVIKIWRRAKVLGIDLENNQTLLFHLKMSGQLVLFNNQKHASNNESRFVGGHPTKDMLGELPNKSTRVIFEFENETKLYFNDQRKFGWIRIVDSLQIADCSFIKTLGPEPLEKSFTWKILKERLLKSKRLPIKVAIMNQQTIAGVGNIYACEALFSARLNPFKKVIELSSKQYQNLHSGIIKSLKAGIKHGGSTKTHFVNADGKKGYFLDHAFVYGKAGDKCKNCKSKIEKIKLAGRGTYLCTKCQSD